MEEMGWEHSLQVGVRWESQTPGQGSQAQLGRTHRGL